MVNSFNNYNVGQVRSCIKAARQPRACSFLAACLAGSYAGSSHAVAKACLLWVEPAQLRCAVLQVFLLSTTAGGAGLNLTGANRLVLLDRWETAGQPALPWLPAGTTPACSPACLPGPQSHMT